MLLLTLNEWFGSRYLADETTRKVTPTERTVALATTLSLGDALTRLKVYEVAYKSRYLELAIEYRLLSVAVIEPQDPSLLASFDVHLVESLAQSPEELD